MTRHLCETVIVRLTPEELAWLDGMAREGFHQSRSALVRSMLCAIMEDEQALSVGGKDAGADSETAHQGAR